MNRLSNCLKEIFISKYFANFLPDALMDIVVA